MVHGRLEKGLVQIYKGSSPGRVEAPLGLAMRAMGHGFRVWWLAPQAPPIPPTPFADLFAYRTADSQGWEETCRALVSGDWDLVILDEGDRWGVEEVLALMAMRPPHVELILTVADCPPAWLDQAHLITAIDDLKAQGG